MTPLTATTPITTPTTTQNATPTPTTTLIPPESSPQPEPLLQFATPLVGWMVDPTQPGQILGTTNGGASWWQSYVGSVSSQSITGTVKGIDFVNATDGWALLYGRGLIATRDGGHTWTTPTEPAALGSIVSFTFSAPGDGWAITDMGVLLQSVDGGQSWRAEMTPEPAITLCATPTGLLWFGSGSGDIYASIGGATWHLSLSGGQVAPPFHNSVGPAPQAPVPWLACVGDSTWALYQYGESAGSDPFVVERTLDGGAHWGQLMSPDGGSLVPPNPMVVLNTPSGLGATGPTSAWIFGYCGPCQTDSPSVVTTANGTSFSGSVLSTAAGVYAAPVGVTFANPQDGWAVLREQPAYTGAPPGSTGPVVTTVVVATSDGGATWDVVDPDV